MERFTGIRSFRGRELVFDGRTKIMGILNVTPDSFSDGGLYGDASSAVSKALQMERDGAAVIDIGGESTRPGAEPVSPEEEISRVVPVIRELRKKSNVFISVDTFHAGTAQEALEAGADIINDISGLTSEPQIADVISEYKAGLVLMNTNRTEGFDFRTQVEFALSKGISETSVIADPGIGFGTTREEDRKLIRGLLDFSLEGRFPVLLALSRKRIVSDLLERETEPKERDAGSFGLEIAGSLLGASMVRVHDVPGTRDSLMTFEKIMYGES